MANQWIVLEDRIKHGKRFLSIEDTLNKRKYSNFFPININNTGVISRFKDHVKEHRSEIVAGGTTLNLTNFEAGL